MKGSVSCFALLLAVVGAAQAKANGLVNGSFEDGPPIPASGYLTLPDGDTSISGWIVKGAVPGGNIDYKDTYWENSDEENSIDLNGSNGPGGIAQTFATIPGLEYLVTFDIAGNPTVGANPVKTLEVLAGGQSQQFVVDNTGRTRQDMGWETRNWVFTATSSDTDLWFRMVFPDSGSEGIGLDDVRVDLVPEPSALVLLLLGGLALIGARRR